MSRLIVFTSLGIALAACGDDGGGVPTVDIDNGQCGTAVRFTGEIVDWDSSDTGGGDFCGVFGATLTGISGGNDETTTAPNGRFDACIPAGGTATAVAVAPAATTSMCAAGTYTTPGAFSADPDVVHAGAEYSLRLFTDARRTSFFTQIGAPYDATKGQLLVHVSGDITRDVTLASDHAAAQAFSKAANAWAAGTHGDYVFFPNVALDGGAVTVAGQQVGAGKVTLAAGTITDITIFTR